MDYESILSRQVKLAQEERAKWPQGRLETLQLEGTSQYCKTNPIPKSSLTAVQILKIREGIALSPEWSEVQCDLAIGHAIADAAVAAHVQDRLDHLNTIMAIFERCGYTEAYACQWPNEKASITFLRFLQEHGFNAAQQKGDSHE